MASLTARYTKADPSKALPLARLHDLRHIHATTLLLAGVPVHVVATEQLVEAADIFANHITAV
jgi:integrase